MPLLDAKVGAGVRFAVTYAVIAAVLLSIYAFPFELFGAKSDWLAGYLAAYARLAGAVLGVFEPTVRVDGPLILGRYSLEIVRNCDASEIMILLGSAVLAHPTKLVRRLGALLLATLSVVMVNVLRICSLYYIGVHFPSAFQAAHEQVWPLLLIVFAAALFLGWMHHEASRSPERAAHAGA